MADSLADFREPLESLLHILKAVAHRLVDLQNIETLIQMYPMVYF